MCSCQRMSRRVLAGSVLVGALALGVTLGMSEEQTFYSRSVSQFLADPIFDRTIRLSGLLVPNTLCKMPDGCEHRFQMYDRASLSAKLPVRYQRCVVPDTFRDVPGLDVDVTLTGELCSGCHTFEAEQILAKCPSKYEMSLDGGSHPYGFTSATRTCNSRGEPNM